MNTKIIKSLALLEAVTALMFLSPAAHAGNESGHGGAGVVQGGLYMTFHDAGFYADEPAEAISQVPGLERLVNVIQGWSFLSELSKTSLVNVIVPSPRHQYFPVQANRFDPVTRARLLAEFARVTKIPAEHLELYAVTDTDTGRTYLLPKFFSLKEEDQATILFHETYWILHPDATYNEVVRAETEFQALMELPGDDSRTLRIMRVLASHGEQLAFAVNSDLRSGALQGLLQDGDKIDIHTLFGDEFLHCVLPDLSVRIEEREGSGKSSLCAQYLNTHLYALRAEHPDSLFLKTLSEKMPTKPGQGVGIIQSWYRHVSFSIYSGYVDVRTGWLEGGDGCGDWLDQPIKGFVQMKPVPTDRPNSTTRRLIPGCDNHDSFTGCKFQDASNASDYFLPFWVQEVHFEKKAANQNCAPARASMRETWLSVD